MKNVFQHLKPFEMQNQGSIKKTVSAISLFCGWLQCILKDCITCWVQSHDARPLLLSDNVSLLAEFTVTGMASHDSSQISGKELS